MADDPEALEREIERTREELALAIDELADRLNPKHVAQRGTDRVKAEAGRLVAAATGRPVEGEPDPAARRVAIAVGVSVGLVVTVTALTLWRRSRR